MSEGTTIHWHGIHQKNSPFMDGVPHISQCPIQPGQTFRYKFIAENSGTHMWHSHLGLQRDDGLVGPLIVRNVIDAHENLYDHDMTEHILLTNDWTHETAVAKFTAHHHGRGDNKPSNILINGKGRYFGNMTKMEATTIQETSQVMQKKIEENFITTSTNEPETETEPLIEISTEELLATTEFFNNEHQRIKRSLLPPDDDSILIPYETFNVVKGYRYRFRHINAGFLNCPIELSIDNHTITAIATDGTDIEPKEVTFLVSYAGERWDFVVNANQAVGNYFIRVRGLMDCDERFTSSFQMAILHYHGANDADPEGIPSYKLDRNGTTLNALNKGYGEENSITIAETKAFGEQENLISKLQPDFKFYMSYDFYGKDNPLFHESELYGFDKTPFGRVYTPQINHITMKLPHVPAMVARDALDSSFCNETSLAAQGINCKETFCQCTHVLQVPLNSVVEMILIDEGVTYDANHMFHLHGHYFHVVGMDRVSRNVTREEIMELDRLGKLRRRLTNSVRKDTVTVPDGGYTILRFYADNPGIWLMHCHIDFHAEVGMIIILKVGDYDQMQPVPDGFPTCSDYKATEKLKSASLKLGLNLNLVLISLIVLSKLV
jgi:FtsP/CotA-like multicopper oxidase with cupredoxin domain